MHSKSILSDDHIAMIGSVNLDFRSLYLHFEVSCLLYQNEAIKDIKRDFENFFNVSRLITLKILRRYQFFKKFRLFLKAFAPLL